MVRSSGPIRPKAGEDVAGDRIRTRRNELGMSQQALAKAADVSRQTIISMEQGNYAPSVYLALRVGAALHATVEDLWR
ncbi:MAG: helix-turn-helix transcriptional regulator [Actinomycetia bacterium]|nr:helix-turn-helix transcriptional regulator [Actinomycetes bacterium]